VHSKIIVALKQFHVQMAKIAKKQKIAGIEEEKLENARNQQSKYHITLIVKI